MRKSISRSAELFPVCSEVRAPPQLQASMPVSTQTPGLGQFACSSTGLKQECLPQSHELSAQWRGRGLYHQSITVVRTGKVGRPVPSRDWDKVRSDKRGPSHKPAGYKNSSRVWGQRMNYCLDPVFLQRLSPGDEPKSVCLPIVAHTQAHSPQLPNGKPWEAAPLWP